MEAFAEKEVCMFVGGNGTKTGVSQAGGCTKEWLLNKGCDPSSLFGTNGACVYQGNNLSMDENGVIVGTAGQFAGIEPGMVAYVDGEILQIYLEVTAVGSNYESITFGGSELPMPDTVDLYVGGAFNSLQQAFFCSTAVHKNCWVFTNKNQTLTAVLNLTYNGGDPAKNTWKRAIGYRQTLYYEDGFFISDMDPGKTYYRSAEQIMQYGVGTGYKIVLDGSAVNGHAVHLQRDNVEIRNLYVIGKTGYDCIHSEGGYTGHSQGLNLRGCAFDGGINGFNGIDGCDNVWLDDCWAGSNITGWGFRLADSSGNGKNIHLSRCIADNCGSGYFINIPAVLEGCLGRNLVIGIHGDEQTCVYGCVLYNMTGAAFECNNEKARLSICNTIAVMNESAQYGVFHVMSGGGNITFEDYNCFVNRLGGVTVLYYENDWPNYYSATPMGLHTIRQNPLFENIAGGQFSLQDGSPCVDAGRPDLCSNKTNIGFYEKPDQEPSEGGGNNLQHHHNRQYGVGRNKQYG
jgi:hypothetical protein